MNEFYTLAYTQWRSMSKFFGALIALVTILILLVYLYPLGGTQNKEEIAGQISTALIIIFTAQTIWVVLLLVRSGDKDELSLTTAEFLNHLPISAWKLGGARMCFGLSTSFGLSLFNTALCYALFDAQFEQALPLADALISTILGYALLQAFIWWLGPAGFIWTAGIFVAIPSLWNIGIITNETLRGFQDAFNASLPDGTTFAWLYTPFFIGFLYLIGVAGIAQNRKGRFSGLGEVSFFRRSTEALESVRSETFGSPEDALRWFEYRRTWKMFPWLLVFSFVVDFFLIYLTLIYSNEGLSTEFHGFHVIGIVQTAAVFSIVSAIFMTISLLSFRAWRQATNHPGSFLFYRPTTTMELSVARWKASVRALVLNLLPVFVIIIFLSFFVVQAIGSFDKSQFGHLTTHQPAVLILLIFAFLFMYAILMAWVTASAETFMGLIGMAALVAIPISSIDGLRSLPIENQEKYESLIATGYVLAYGFMIVGTMAILWYFRRAMKYLNENHLISKKPLLFLTALSPVIAIGLVALANFEQIATQKPLNYSDLKTFPVLLIAILAPILITPGTIHWNRHRK